MKTGRTLTELAQELDRQQNSKKDFLADTTQLQVTEDLRLNMAGVTDTYPVTRHAHRQIGERLKVPAPYYDRIKQDHPELLATTLNTLFHEKSERRMIRTLDGEARAFLSDRYRALDNYDLAEAVLPILHEAPEIQIASCEVTEHRMYIKAVFPRTEMEVKKGDPVQAGVVISNSETGKGSLQVAPLIYRLVCLNGMIAADHGQRKYHVGRAAEGGDLAYEIFRDETLKADDKALWMKVQDTVRASLDVASFGKIVEQMRRSQELVIEGDPVKAVEVVQQQFGLTDDERGGVLRNLIQGGDLSAYGVLNAITRHSQDVADYTRATELETFGGRVLELPSHQWEEISKAA